MGIIGELDHVVAELLSEFHHAYPQGGIWRGTAHKQSYSWEVKCDGHPATVPELARVLRLDLEALHDTCSLRV